MPYHPGINLEKLQRRDIPDEPDPLRRRIVLAGGATLAVGAAGGAAWVMRDEIGDFAEKMGGRAVDEDEGYEDGPSVPVANVELRPHRHFEPVGTRFSSEAGAFGDMVRSPRVVAQIDARFRGARRLGGGSEDGVAFGIGEQSPIEFVRTHIRSVMEALLPNPANTFEEWMMREMPSVAPALLAMESSFSQDAVNLESGARSVAQFMEPQRDNVEADLRRAGLLAPGASLNPSSLNDMVAFVGAYFVNVYKDFKNRMHNHTYGGLELRNVRRLVFQFEEGVSPETPENRDRRERFEKFFLFPAIVHAYKMGVPNFNGLINRFNNEELEARKNELSHLPPGTHAAYGEFLNIMRPHEMRTLDENDEMEYPAIVMGMRERIDAAFPARR